MPYDFQENIFTSNSPPPLTHGDKVHPERPIVFILPPGGWSGDMWHCAVATALCQSEDQDAIAAYPVTIIGMKEKVSWTPDGSGKVFVSRDNSIFHGGRTYNYFHSIQIPALLARINKLEGNFRAAFNRNLVGVSGEYLSKIVALHREYYRNPQAVCSMMWSLTPETEGAANESTIPLLPNVAHPNSLPTEVLFSNEGEIPELVKGGVSPPYKFDGKEEIRILPDPTLHLWTSTTITMQYLYDSDKRPRRIQYLQEQLGNVSNTNST